jgi:predicted GNAT family acetyltransferase
VFPFHNSKNIKKSTSEHGRLRKITMADKDTIKEWVYQFCIDINESQTRKEAEEITTQVIGKGKLFGWEKEGTLVSMANATRPTKHNITINYVYTPLSERKKGYASNCVLALTQLMLTNGFHSTSLYTDLDNLTTNKIYIEIGYEPVMDFIVVHWDK